MMAIVLITAGNNNISEDDKDADIGARGVLIVIGVDDRHQLLSYTKQSPTDEASEA